MLMRLDCSGRLEKLHKRHREKIQPPSRKPQERGSVLRNLPNANLSKTYIHVMTRLSSATRVHRHCARVHSWSICTLERDLRARTASRRSSRSVDEATRSHNFWICQQKNDKHVSTWTCWRSTSGTSPSLSLWTWMTKGQTNAEEQCPPGILWSNKDLTCLNIQMCVYSCLKPALTVFSSFNTPPIPNNKP